MLKLFEKPLDTDLVFYICTYRDSDLLCKCLSHIRLIYNSRIIVVSDGDEDPSLTEICNDHKSEFYLSENMYDLKFGGIRHHRMLDLFLKSPAKYLLKIDTDTKICGRFDYMPWGCCVFGDVKYNKVNYIQGGFIGYPIEVVQKLYQEKVFLNPDLSNNPLGTWAKINDSISKAKRGRISEDMISAYCTRMAGIPLVRHKQVLSHNSTHFLQRDRSVENLENRYAVIHPCKDCIW